MSVRVTIRACLVPALLAGVVCAGCTPAPKSKPPVDTARVVDSIKSDEVRWNADWRSGDAAKVATHYSPDAVLMAPGVKTAVGATAIRQAIEEAVSQKGFSLTFASDQVEVAASGDLATARGAYKQTSPNATTGAVDIETGSYVTVYRPGPDGVWRAVWDINTPGAAYAQ